MKIAITKVTHRIAMIKYIADLDKCTHRSARIKVDSVITNPITIDAPAASIPYLKKICEFEILDETKAIPPYLDNERTSYINTSSHPDDEPKQDTLELFHVKFTKVIHYDEMLNERQIQSLLKDNHVKSINIEK